jgi:hypothetical protein
MGAPLPEESQGPSFTRGIPKNSFFIFETCLRLISLSAAGPLYKV